MSQNSVHLSPLQMTSNRICSEEQNREGETAHINPQNERPALSFLPPLPQGPVSLLTPYVPRHLNVPLYAKIMKITNSPGAERACAVCATLRMSSPCTSKLCPHAHSALDFYRKLLHVMSAKGYGGRKRAVTWNTFSVAITKLLIYPALPSPDIVHQLILGWF